MKKLLPLIFLMFIPFISSGQEGYKINGSVFDLETNSPVPFASVINLDDASGTTTDINGKFQLFITDTTIKKYHITAIGFHDTILHISYQQTGLEIFLKPYVYDFEEVEISGTRLRRDSIGSRSYQISVDENGKSYGTPTSSGWFNGVYVVPNIKNDNALLTSIHLYVADQGFLNSPFLLRMLIPKKTLEGSRVYSFSNFYDHLKEEIIIKTEKRGWNSFDLYDREVRMPNEPFMLLFIPLDKGDQYIWEDDMGIDRYGSVIADYRNYQFWRGGIWRLFGRREELFKAFYSDGKLAFWKTPGHRFSVPAVVINYLE